jgi:tetratricopeptide (TPR) repeat protein
MRLRPFIGWGVFLFLIAILTQALPSPQATYYFFQGKQRFKSGDYAAAAQSYRQAVTVDPTFARGFIELGLAQFALENYPEAGKAFQDAMAIKEDSCAACGVGMIHRVEGRKDEAEKALQKSIQLDSQDTCAYDQLGRLYYDAKDYPKAMEAFRKRIELKPHAVAFHYLANSMYLNGQAEQSIDVYRKATHLAPDYQNVLVDLGRAYGQLGKYDEAVKVLKRAVELDPDDLKARSFLGVAQFISGDRVAAQRQYQVVLTKDSQLGAEMLKGFTELSPQIDKLERISAERSR